jgi:hypothetical protein
MPLYFFNFSRAPKSKSPPVKKRNSPIMTPLGKSNFDPGDARAARLPGQIHRGANSTRHNRQNIQERYVSKMTHRRTKPRTNGGISSPSVVAAASRRGERKCYIPRQCGAHLRKTGDPGHDAWRWLAIHRLDHGRSQGPASSLRHSLPAERIPTLVLG